MGLKKREKTSLNAESLRKNIDNKISDSAIDEPAWKVITQEPKIYIWRIEEFKPKLLDTAHHGEFFDGDSYIILHAYLSKSKRVCYDVFIWIGKHSTADEYGTAAYKMAELDIEVLKGAAIQHREVQSNESQKFLDLFEKIIVCKGGINSGFNQVKNAKPEPKLFHISGERKNVKIEEISFRKDNITDEDVFVIDLFDNVYQVNGKNCSKDEKFKGAAFFNELKAKRSKAVFEVIDDYVPGMSHPAIDSMKVTNKMTLVKKKKQAARELSLWRLSDSTGKMVMTQISKGKAQKSSLDTKDVFILDCGEKIYVWIGKNTSKKEKFGALPCAQQYAEKMQCPNLPLISICEGNEPEDFTALLS